MWGQRIWQISSDSVKPWEQWDYQSCTVIPNCKNGDRGDNTQNHWYVYQSPKFASLLFSFHLESRSRIYVCDGYANASFIGITFISATTDQVMQGIEDAR